MFVCKVIFTAATNDTVLFDDPSMVENNSVTWQTFCLMYLKESHSVRELSVSCIL